MEEEIIKDMNQTSLEIWLGSGSTYAIKLSSQSNFFNIVHTNTKVTPWVNLRPTEQDSVGTVISLLEFDKNKIRQIGNADSGLCYDKTDCYVAKIADTTGVITTELGEIPYTANEDYIIKKSLGVYEVVNIANNNEYLVL